MGGYGIEGLSEYPVSCLSAFSIIFIKSDSRDLCFYNKRHRPLLSVDLRP